MVLCAFGASWGKSSVGTQAGLSPFSWQLSRAPRKPLRAAQGWLGFAFDSWGNPDRQEKRHFCHCGTKGPCFALWSLQRLESETQPVRDNWNRVRMNWVGSSTGVAAFRFDRVECR